MATGVVDEFTPPSVGGVGWQRPQVNAGEDRENAHFSRSSSQCAVSKAESVGRGGTSGGVHRRGGRGGWGWGGAGLQSGWSSVPFSSVPVRATLKALEEKTIAALKEKSIESNKAKNRFCTGPQPVPDQP
jgi:hypothetical protein